MVGTGQNLKRHTKNHCNQHLSGIVLRKIFVYQYA